MPERISDKPGTTTQGIFWQVGPSYNRGEMSFGFGPLRPVTQSGEQVGQELVLYSLTPDEAMEIAWALRMWSVVAGLDEKGGDEHEEGAVRGGAGGVG